MVKRFVTVEKVTLHMFQKTAYGTYGTAKMKLSVITGHASKNIVRACNYDLTSRKRYAEIKSEHKHMFELCFIRVYIN